MRLLKTESGAEYEIFGDRVRRLEGASGNTKRADGEWIKLANANEFSQSESLVGKRLIMQIEQLSALGPDDCGNEQSSVSGGYTTRVSTPVVVDSWWTDEL